MTRRKRNVVIGAFIVVVIAILTSLTMMAGDDEYEITMRDWIAAGGARTLAELEPAPVPEQANAATYYRLAFATIDDLPPSVTEAVQQTMNMDELAAALDAIPDEVIENALDGAQRTECVWGSTLHIDGFEALLPHLAQTRVLAHILTADMLLHANRGEHDIAMERLEATLNLAQHAKVERLLISMLIGVSIEQLAIERFWQAYSEAEFIPALARRLFDRDVNNTITDLREMLLAEGTVAAFAIAEDGISPLPRALRRREAGIHLSTMLALREEITKPYPDQDVEAIEEDIPFWAGGMRQIMPRISRVVRNVLLGDRQFLAMQAALDIRAYGDEHGEYPDSWDMPIDPLTGDPIDYERTDEGFTISAPAIGRRPGIHWDWRRGN